MPSYFDTAESVRGPERNQCLRCGGHISWSRWFCNPCAKAEGLTVANGLAPSKPKRKRRDDTSGGAT